MSGGAPCRCPGTREERMRNWVVLQYKCNHSAFNGYRYTPSDYSSVVCKGPGAHGQGCSGCWRTTAKYVDDLPMHKESTDAR